MADAKRVKVGRNVATGRQKIEEQDVQFPSSGIDNKVAVVGVLEETGIDHSAFTDGGGAAGTYQMRGAIPKGAVVLGARVKVPEGFAGDTTATVQIGDGSDADRYSTGTPSVFATAADGIQIGIPSGTKTLTASNRPTITVTGTADWGSVTAGKLDVAIYYIEA